MAKTKKPAQKKGGAAKPAPKKKPMRRKSKRATALPHVDVTAPKRKPIQAAAEPKPTLWHRFRSAITGLFVSKQHADANPATTIREKAD